MTKQVQRRRGTATQHTSFTGAEGELSVNTTNKSVHVHDGSTAGGIELARKDGSNVAFTSGTLDGVTIGGNTAGAGTFTNLTATGTTTLAGASTSANITFGDNDKAIFGASSDLQIYSDGTNGYIEEAGGGNLRIITNGPSVAINKGTVGGENMAVFNADGAVQLFYDASQKLATTSSGVDISGSITADGLSVAASSPNVSIQGNSATDASLTLTSAGVTSWALRNEATDAALYFTRDGASKAKLAYNGDISFYEDTGTTAKFFWDASAERLGLGTTSPQTSLHIQQTSATAILRLHRTGATNAADAELGQIEFYNADGTSDGPNVTGKIVGSTHTSSGAGGNLRFFTHDGSEGGEGSDPVERVRIDGAGNVGIGTSSPTAVSGTTALEVTGTSGNAGAEVIIGSSDTTATVGDLFGGLAFKSIDSNGTPSHYSGIKAKAADTYGGANLEFYAGRSNYESNDPRLVIEGPQSVSGEAMRIDSSGNVGIGTSSPAANRALHVSSTAQNQARFERTGSATSQIEFNDSTTTNQPSLGGVGDNLTFRTSFTERMRIDSSGNVGIGTSSPASLLHLSSASDTYFTMGTSNATADARIQFRNSGGTDAGGLWYATNSNSMQFRTNSAERMRIDSSGNLLVGTTSTTPAFSSTVSGIALKSSETAISANSAIALILNRTTSDGSIAQFRKDGTTVGSIGAKTGDLAIGTGDTGILFDDGNDAVYAVNPANTFGTRDALISLGTSSVRFKDLYLSGGVYLGGTGSANHLDDYEEGTWTPTLKFGGNAVGQSYSVQSGYYTKVGRIVILSFNVNLSNKGTSTGQATIDGSPFAQFASTQFWGGQLIFEGGGVSANNVNNYAMPWSDGNLYLRYQNSTQYAALSDSNFSNTTRIFSTCIFQVN